MASYRHHGRPTTKSAENFSDSSDATSGREASRPGRGRPVHILALREERYQVDPFGESRATLPAEHHPGLGRDDKILNGSDMTLPAVSRYRLAT